MRFFALLCCSVFALVVACGEEEGTNFVPPEGGSGGAPAPVEPQVGALEMIPSATNVSAVLVRWQPATDDATPQAELTYELRFWRDRPAAGQAPDDTFQPPCTAVCSFDFSPLSAGEVFWFQVAAKDADGNEGLSPLTPVTQPGGAPVLEAPVPASGTEEDRVTIRGENLLDEPVTSDALKLNGVAIDLAPYEPGSPSTGYLEDWSNTAITFRVPENAQSGLIEITVFGRTAESTAEFTVE